MKNSHPAPTSGVPSGSTVERLRTVWLRFTAPSAAGLPNRWVLGIFPALVFVLLVVFVGLGVTGSSTGYLNQFFSTKADPALIAGHPQPVRSDEWAVQTAWTISQVEEGLPVMNHTFPGGIDTTVQSDLPSTDWSVAFRPHLLGFYFLPLNNAMALKWWLPAFALIVACYLFAVTLLPRRPVSAALLSVGFFFAPFFQWWYLPVTFWPAAWCFATMAAAVWMLRSRSRRARLAWAAAVAYLTVTMGVGVYVPFIVPSIYVALFVIVGAVLGRRNELTPFRERLRRISPLIGAGVIGVAILVLWVVTRLGTIERFLGTVYPGQRFEHTGHMDFHALLALLGAPVSPGLGDVGGQPLGGNPSEASTFFLVGLFLIVGFAWLIWHDRRTARSIDWLVVTTLAVGVLFIVFLLVPGWDLIAHLVLLDRTTDGRLRIGLGLLSVVAMVLYAERTDAHRAAGRRLPHWVPAASGVLALIAVGGLCVDLLRWHAPIVTASSTWIVTSVLFLVSVTVLSAGAMFVASAGFLVMSVIASSGVNPLYVGVYDLNRTAVMKQMKSVQRADPGRWVGVGDGFLPTALLVQSGLPGYNGFQGAPPRKMWKQIDPAGRYEQEWNRLANISWVSGSGAPDPRNPAADQIQMTFDSCASFAQHHVEHVVSVGRLDQACLSLDKTVKQGPTTFSIYDVVEK